MPFTSSTSRKALKNSRILSITKSPYAPGRLHPDGDHHQPDDRERYEHLPAEPHDLVVAVARERRPEPQEQRHHEEDLGEQPREWRDRAQKRRIDGRRPTAAEHDRGDSRNEDPVGVLTQGEQREGHTGGFDVETRDDFG